MNERRSYWTRLKDHPGVPVATAVTVLGFVAGLDRGLEFAAFASFAVGGWCWAMVLLSNRGRV